MTSTDPVPNALKNYGQMFGDGDSASPWPMWDSNPRFFISNKDNRLPSGPLNRILFSKNERINF